MSTDLSNLALMPRPDGIELTIKVVPGASRDRIAGAWGTGLRITVAAPPEDGKANAAVEQLLATSFDIPAAQVRIVRGRTNFVKVVLFRGINAAQLRMKLNRALA